MTMADKDNLQGLLILHLTDDDVKQPNSSGRVRRKLDLVVETSNISQLLINLERVSFLSSVGIGQLIMLKKKCDQKQIALAVCNISPQNMKVLRLVRCDEIIDLFEDQESAMKSLVNLAVPAPSALLSAEELAGLNDRIEAGDQEAMFELAQRMVNADGLEQDPSGAVELYNRAADGGHCESQFQLATCYAFGLGVPQDYELAMPWYQKAAEQGHSDAQYMVGMSFQYALNDVSDLQLAKSWYTQAAEQGHEKARIALQELSQ